MFGSPYFWIALAAGVPLYWLLPRWVRPYFLLALSTGLLIRLDWKSTAIMYAWALGFYYGVRPGEAGKWRLFATTLVLGLVSHLVWVKYLPPIRAALHEGSPPAKVLIPLGMSYFVFKLVHYAIEVRAGNIEVPRLPIFLCYLILFPIVPGGPIERFERFSENIDDKITQATLVEGTTRIVLGLIKRFVVAELFLSLAMYVAKGERLPSMFYERETFSVGQAWGSCLLYYLYVYIEFSAFSDLAIGSSRLFGITISENFNWPLLAVNLTEFWKRWHMTLSNWCQTYVYMPFLGLTRNPYVAAYSSFLVMGLWHAASPMYVLWGAWQATGVIVSSTVMRKLKKPGKPKKKSLPERVVGMVATNAYVALASAFTIVWANNGTAYESFRILARLIGIQLAK